MAILTAISEATRDNSPNPKKQRLMMDSEETQEDDPAEEETTEELEEDEAEEEEVIEDEEEVVEDERSTETVKLDDDEEEDEQEDSIDDHKRRFFLTDFQIFDCSVCRRRLGAPIVYLCEGEHLACGGCFSASSACALCTPPAGYKRSGILEKILKSVGQSCENLGYGCNRPVHYTMKVEHERYCKFGPCSCPVDGCGFVAPSTQLSEHLTADHPESVTRFLFGQLYSIGLGYDERFCVLQEMSRGDVFVVRNVKHDIGNMIGVNQIGPLSFRSQFSIDLEAKDGKCQSLRFKCEIECVRGLGDETHQMRDFLLVPSKYFEGNKGFELLLRISHSGS